MRKGVRGGGGWGEVSVCVSFHPLLSLSHVYKTSITPHKVLVEIEGEGLGFRVYLMKYLVRVTERIARLSSHRGTPQHSTR